MIELVLSGVINFIDYLFSFLGEEANPASTAAPTPSAAGAKGINFLKNKRASMDHPAVPAPAAVDSPMGEVQEPKSELEATKDTVDSPKANESAMDLDPEATNFDALENSQEDPAVANANFDTNANNAFDTNFNQVDASFAVPAQEAPQVPESILGDSQEDVQDDLTATSYISTKENDVLMSDGKEMEKHSAAIEGMTTNDGIERGQQWTKPNDVAKMDEGPKMTSPDFGATKQQPSFKATTAARVSLSPQNAANRNARNSGVSNLSPLRNAMFNSNPTNRGGVGLANSGTLNQTEISLENVNEFQGTSNLSDGLANFNDNTTMLDVSDNCTDAIMDDDQSIIIPGEEPIPNNEYQPPDTSNLAQFGTESTFDNGFSMDLNSAADGAKDDFTMVSAGKNVGASANVAHAKTTGFNANYGAQNQQPNASRTSIISRTAANHVGAHSGPMGNRPRSNAFSFAQTTQKQRAAVNVAAALNRGNQASRGPSKPANASHAQVSHGPSKTVNASEKPASVTPPGRNGNVMASLTRLGNSGNQANTAVTPDATMQNRVRTLMQMPPREMQKQPAVEAHNDTSVERHIPDASSFSPPPSGNSDASTTPKISNMQAQPAASQPKDVQWNISVAESSCSNLSFDELLNKFLEDIQEAADLNEAGANDLLDLEVELSHAFAASLRYKGDIMDLLDEVEEANANVERMLVQL